MKEPPERRVLEHFEVPGNPAAWTRKHCPRSLVELAPGGTRAETAKTLELMATHGAGAVRGGAWCQLELSEETLRELGHMVAHEEGKCVKCGGAGHWAARCPRRRAPRVPKQRVVPCGRCNKRGHTTEECRAYQDAGGRTLPCLHCGRTSHTHRDCYAKTTADGERIVRED